MVTHRIGNNIVLYIDRAELERRIVATPERFRATLEQLVGAPLRGIEVYAAPAHLLVFAVVA